jgi:hypothetical protein
MALAHNLQCLMFAVDRRWYKHWNKWGRVVLCFFCNWLIAGGFLVWFFGCVIFDCVFCVLLLFFGRCEN